VETAEESLERLRDEVAALQASRRRLVLAGESERQSIERELHEGPQQHFVALAVNLQLARQLVDSDPAAAAALIDDMGRDVDVALEETGKLAHRIYPPLLEAGGLTAALRAAAVNTGVQARIRVDANALANIDSAGVLYFCCLEALECAGRGARATIEVRVEDGVLVFEVADDGAMKNVGYDGMRDRVEALGGSLSVLSEPDGGNRIYGSLPLRR
jgi:signal transduction histidine kinase